MDEADTSAALEGLVADGGDAVGYRDRDQEVAVPKGLVANGGDAARQCDRDEAPAVVKCPVSDGGDAAGNIHVALRVGLVQAAVTLLARHTLRSLPYTRSECEQQHGAGTREALQDERSRASGPQSFVTGHEAPSKRPCTGAWQIWNNAITNSYMCMSEQSINTKV